MIRYFSELSRFAFPLVLMLGMADRGFADAVPAGGADVAYTLPTATKISLSVIDARGWIVRELLRAYGEEAGAHAIHWDGNDDFGRPCPPGDYTWKAVYGDGIKAEYVLSVGNSGQPPYRTDDNTGSWGGCHGNPLSVRADANGLYLTWACEEGNAVFAHTDYDGHALYKIHNSFPFGGNYDSALAGNFLYRIEASSTASFIEKFTLTDGKAAAWDWKDPRVMNFRLQIEPQPRPTPDPKLRQDPKYRQEERHQAELHQPGEIAVSRGADGTIAVSFPNLDQISLFKPTGEPLPDLLIPSPRGLLFLSDGRLLVAEPGKIVAVKLADRSVTPLITSDLDQPFGIALATDGKSLWITDQGKSNQVKQFSLDGKLLQSFGKAGGMQDGLIDHNNFRNPRGIACGTDGNIYVTEDSALRRITRWSQDGKLLREWFGPVGPQLSCWPDLSDFSRIYYPHHDGGTIVECHVDFDKKSWAPVSWWTLPERIGLQPYVFERQGKRYLYSDRGLLYLYDEKADRWNPVFRYWWPQTDPKTQPSQGVWSDLNGNGQVDEGETQVFSPDDLKAKGLLAFKPGNLRFDPETFAFTANIGGDLIRMTPDHITDAGVPVYLLAKLQILNSKTPGHGPNSWVEFGRYDVDGATPASDGGYLTIFNGGRQPFLAAWDRASWNNVVKFGPDGRLQWEANGGGHWKQRGVIGHDGTRMFMRVPGIAKGILFVTDVEGQFRAFTEDGLYVSSLMDECSPLTPNSITVENVVGLVADDPKTHESYLFCGVTEDVRIFHLTGFDSLARLNGKIFLKTAASLAATDPGSATADTYEIAGTKPPRPLQSGDAGADGFLNEPEWAGAQALPIFDNGVLKARLYLRRDDQYLWVGAHVIDSSPAQNAAQDPENAFTGGDCVDLYFGADPVAAAKRDAPDVGDLRILFYPASMDKSYNGKIVILRAKIPPGMVKHPFEYSSPVGTVDMESVTTVDGKDTVSKQGLCTFYRWPSGQGYTLEAKIPFDAIPELNLARDGAQAAHKVAFDAGVIFSNDGGNDRASRLYWHQIDDRTQMVQDIPTEAGYHPRLWGTAQVDSVLAPGGKP
jgi:hypothetical protein